MLKNLIGGATFCAGFVLAAAGPAAAADYTMDFATVSPVAENNFSWTHMEVLQREIEARSGGQIDVTMYPGGQLGGIESLVNQVQDGIIQAADPSDGHFASTFPEIQVFGIPYLFPSREVAWRVLDGPFGDKMRERMIEATGLRPLFWSENGGFRHYSVAGREIDSIDDLEGIKMRTMNHPLHMEIARSLGMSPTPVAWGELYTALQTGVVEGQENAIPTFLVPRLYEVQDSMILDGHVYSINTIVVNNEWYEGLPEDLQAAIDQAAQIALTTNRGLSVSNEVVGRAFLEEQGVQIYDPTAAERQELRERAQPQAVEWLRSQSSIDGALIDEVLEAVAEAEEHFGYR